MGRQIDMATRTRILDVVAQQQPVSVSAVASAIEGKTRDAVRKQLEALTELGNVVKLTSGDDGVLYTLSDYVPNKRPARRETASHRVEQRQIDRARGASRVRQTRLEQLRSEIEQWREQLRAVRPFIAPGWRTLILQCDAAQRAEILAAIDRIVATVPLEQQKPERLLEQLAPAAPAPLVDPLDAKRAQFLVDSAAAEQEGRAAAQQLLSASDAQKPALDGTTAAVYSEPATPSEPSELAQHLGKVVVEVVERQLGAYARGSELLLKAEREKLAAALKNVDTIGHQRDQALERVDELKTTIDDLTRQRDTLASRVEHLSVELDAVDREALQRAHEQLEQQQLDAERLRQLEREHADMLIALGQRDADIVQLRKDVETALATAQENQIDAERYRAMMQAARALQ